MEVRHLPTEGPIDPKSVLDGKWRSIWTTSLSPGQAEELAAGPVEYAVYVTGGSGVLRSNPTGERAVAEGSGIVVLRDSEATLVAGDAGLELFAIAVDT